MKKVVSIMVILCMFFMMSGCASVSDSKWQSAYEDYMADKSGSMVLVDLDDDNIPELIVDNKSSKIASAESADNKHLQTYEVYTHNVFIAKYVDGEVVDCTLNLVDMCESLQAYRGDNDNQLLLIYCKFTSTGLAANNYAIDGYNTWYKQIVDISDSEVKLGSLYSDNDEAAYKSVSYKNGDVFSPYNRASDIEKAIEVYNENNK